MAGEVIGRERGGQWQIWEQATPRQHGLDTFPSTSLASRNGPRCRAGPPWPAVAWRTSPCPADRIEAAGIELGAVNARDAAVKMPAGIAPGAPYPSIQ